MALNFPKSIHSFDISRTKSYGFDISTIDSYGF